MSAAFRRRPAPAAAGESPSAKRLARVPAPAKAAFILAYFGIVAIWLPSVVLRTRAVSGASAWVSDVIGVGLWAAAIASGLAGLRAAQARGVI